MKTIHRGYQITLPDPSEAVAFPYYAQLVSSLAHPIALQPVNPDDIPSSGGRYAWEVPFEKGVVLSAPVAATLLRQGVLVNSESVFPTGARGSTAPDIHVITRDDVFSPSILVTHTDPDDLTVLRHNLGAHVATNQHGQVIGVTALSINQPLYAIAPAITAAALPACLPLRMGWEQQPGSADREGLVVFDQNSLEIVWPRASIGAEPRRWDRHAATVTVRELPFDERTLIKFGGLGALEVTAAWARQAYAAGMPWLDALMAPELKNTGTRGQLLVDTLAIALTELHALDDRCTVRPNGAEESAVVNAHADRLLAPLIARGEFAQLIPRLSTLSQLRINSNTMATLVDPNSSPMVQRWPSPRVLTLSVPVPPEGVVDTPAFIADLMATTHRTLVTGGFNRRHEILDVEGHQVYLDEHDADYDIQATLRLASAERLNTASGLTARSHLVDGQMTLEIQIPAPYIGGPMNPSLCQVLQNPVHLQSVLVSAVDNIREATARASVLQPPAFSAQALADKTRALDALSRQLLSNTAAGVRDVEVLAAHERARIEILGITTSQNMRLDYETFDVDMRAQQMAIGQAKVTQIVWEMGGLLGDWEASKGSIAPWSYARWLPAFGGDSVAIGVSSGGVVQVNGDPFCRALPSGIVTLNIDSNVIRASMADAVTPTLAKENPTELQPYIVLYRESDNAMLADPPLAFACQAEDADHAEEQALNAYSGAAVAWVYQGDSQELAYEDFFTAGDPVKQSIYVISVSREVITPESAAEGSYDSLETTIDAQPYNFDELERLVRELGINEASSSRPEPGAWFRSTSPEHNRAYFEKDEQAFYSLFVKSINGRPLDEEDVQRLANALDIRFSQPLNLNAEKTSSPSSASPAP